MFFQREKPRNLSFDQRLDNARQYGFTIEREDGGRARVVRDGCAAVIEDRPERPHVNKAGMLVGTDIALSVHGGYQTFWRTPGGRILPALAPQLKALHRFEEDLKEALGLTSLYNESLGTTFDQHMYDRVVNRDRRTAPRPWERKPWSQPKPGSPTPQSR
jgi:hypothetical protein